MSYPTAACAKAPRGWRCIRIAGHLGPCAARKNPTVSHQAISFVKSGIRLAGYVLMPIDLTAAAVILFLSEVIGIYEEVGH